MKLFIPLRDRILVRPSKREQKGRLSDPNSQQEVSTTGTVITVGPEVADGRIHDGVVIDWRKYSGVEKRVGGEVLLLLREDEVEGIWEEADE